MPPTARDTRTSSTISSPSRNSGECWPRPGLLHDGRAADLRPLVVLDSRPGHPLPLRAIRIRISFWGYLFNLAPLGIVGGDLVKAVMLDHEHRGYRAKAVASVFADRVIGLYVLFLVATAAILLTGYYWQVAAVPRPATISAGHVRHNADQHVGVGVGHGARRGDGRRLISAIGRIPRVGRPLQSLIDAVRMYRTKPGVLALSSVMTVGVHSSSRSAAS